MQNRHLIAVVDDDESVRESLPHLLTALGFAGRAFASASAFLESDATCQAHCLLLDIAMPEMSGPELQRELYRRGSGIPIIFISGDCDENLRSSLLARGAVACLTKPFTEEELRSAVALALEAA